MCYRGAEKAAAELVAECSTDDAQDEEACEEDNYGERLRVGQQP